MKRFLLFALLCLSIVAAHAKAKIRVACVGNSVTYGYLLPDPSHDAYPAQLQQMLGNDYEVGNFGHSGATLLSKGHRPYIKQEAYRRALDFKADIVVIHLGLNDTDPRNWPNYGDMFTKDYIDLVQSFKKVNPKARILIARMSPISHRHPRFLAGTRDWFEAIQQKIEVVAKAVNAQLIDFYEPLITRPDLFEDGLHPDKEGASIIARTVFQAITGNYGGLKLSPLYSDNMVLQVGSYTYIKGTADAGETVWVTFEGRKMPDLSEEGEEFEAKRPEIIRVGARTKTDIDGRWEVMFTEMSPFHTYDLTVKTRKKELRFSNVVFGEVWLCSGQSNMAFPLHSASTAQEDLPQAADPQLRFFNMQPRWETTDTAWNTEVLDSVNRLQYFKPATWSVCTPQSAKDVSAVGYYFGKSLRTRLQLPVGLILNAVGGAPTEAWVERQRLEKGFPEVLDDRFKNNVLVQDWVIGRERKNLTNATKKLQRHPYQPSYLFDAAIRPLEKYKIQGAIWYQGESNAHNIEMHDKLFSMVRHGWNYYWGLPAMSFYYVQLSSLNRPSWGAFRDSQNDFGENFAYQGMAVSIDVGDSLDVHPRNKRPVGERLARLALYKTYGKRDILPCGPMLEEVDAKKNKVFVRFKYGYGLHTSDGKPLRSFELAGEDEVFYPATAVIEDDTVVIQTPKVKKPQWVRYAYEPFTRANLVNEENLPASTFKASIYERD